MLTSGTAFALAGSSTVFGDDIVDGEVTTADVADDDTRRALRGTDVRNGSLTAGDFAADSVTGARINESSLSGLFTIQGGSSGLNPPVSSSDRAM